MPHGVVAILRMTIETLVRCSFTTAVDPLQPVVIGESGRSLKLVTDAGHITHPGEVGAILLSVIRPAAPALLPPVKV